MFKMELTEKQRDFIVHSFFLLRNMSGTANIGHNLLIEGNCIVPSTKSIYKGEEIDNFIETEEIKNKKGFLLYKFNLDEFFKSDLFKNNLSVSIYQAKLVVRNKIEDLRELNKLKSKVEENEQSK